MFIAHASEDKEQSLGRSPTDSANAVTESAYDEFHAEGWY